MTTNAVPVSVIIPCYRCKETVETSLNSTLSQTLQPSEILLVDDGSGDGTLDLLRDLERAHAPKVRVISKEENAGPGSARNAGWEVATQPWLAFLDADDVWHPRKLEIQWNWLATHPEVALCGHDSRFTEGLIDSDFDARPNATRVSPWQMLLSNRLPTRSVMLRRDLPFRFEGRHVTEDYLLWLQIITAGFPTYRIECCLAYSLRPDFSPGGYSGQLWTHEIRELRALQVLWHTGCLSLATFLLASGWSFLKLLRRLRIIRNMR